MTASKTPSLSGTDLDVLTGGVDEDEAVNPNEPRDISPEEFLGLVSENVTGHFEFKTATGETVRVQIAALTEGENEGCLAIAKKPSGPGGKGPAKTNLSLAKQLSCALSINKAAGTVDEFGRMLPGAITHQALKKALGGHLTELYRKVTEISGFEDREQDPTAFFD